MTSVTDKPETSADLDELVMHDGITWCAEGPRGKLWTIIWQPARTGDNIRAWPFPGGKTAHWGHAADADDARAEALRIAALIATGRKAA
jgi:hypothetical protein